MIVSSCLSQDQGRVLSLLAFIKTFMLRQRLDINRKLIDYKTEVHSDYTLQWHDKKENIDDDDKDQG